MGIKMGIFHSFVLLIVFLIATTACESKDPIDMEKRVIRIAVMDWNPDKESYIRTLYTDLYEFTNEEISFEFIRPDQTQVDPIKGTIEELASENPADLVFLNYAVLPEFIDQNLLINLDAFIKRDKYDISDISPNVINAIRAFGDTKLYGLAPTFSSSVLIYNKTLFDNSNTPYPSMITWDGVFDLARHIKMKNIDKNVYGFSFSWSWHEELYGSLMQSLVPPLDLHFVNNTSDKMTVNNTEWESIWSTIEVLIDEKIIPNHQEINEINIQNNTFGENAFLSGKVAMTIIDYRNFSRMLQLVNNSKLEIPFEWDISTFPVHSHLPQLGRQMSMEPLISVNSRAQNIEDSWDFIKFVNSNDWAKFKFETTDNLLSRVKYNTQLYNYNYNIEAFYSLVPPPIDLDYAKTFLEKPYLQHIDFLGKNIFNKVLIKELTVEEGLKKWETEGNKLLEIFKLNPDASIDNLLN